MEICMYGSIDSIIKLVKSVLVPFARLYFNSILF
jgi:hypothetical protein